MISVQEAYVANRATYDKRLNKSREILNGILFQAMQCNRVEDFKHEVFLTTLHINESQADTLIKELAQQGWKAELVHSAYRTPGLTRLSITITREAVEKALNTPEPVETKKRKWWQLW